MGRGRQASGCHLASGLRVGVGALGHGSWDLRVPLDVAVAWSGNRIEFLGFLHFLLLAKQERK